MNLDVILKGVPRPEVFPEVSTAFLTWGIFQSPTGSLLMKCVISTGKICLSKFWSGEILSFVLS